ncbi:hypothetical protein [Kineococcus arenarius]|uniref:hypothetical protein n=1 Tax=unclassified Kineococcus TaxID=2621656 RepID=UPI003D7D140C
MEDELSGIQQALVERGASLHLVRRDRHVVGFCTLIPRGGFLEIRYLVTDPEV